MRALNIIHKYGFIIYPFLFIFGVGCFIYLTSLSIFPDFLHLKHYSKIYELFNLIISSLVSLIGIYISVSLVAYEFFKQKSGIDFHKSMLVNNLNSYFISFSVLTIFFTFICSIKISPETPTYRDLSLVYFAIVIFSIVILSLFFVAFNLFSSLKPEKSAHDEIQKLNSETIFIPSIDDIDKQADLFENDHLVKIESIIIALISVSNNIKAQAIILKTTSKLSNLIIDEKNNIDKEYIIDRLISFYIKIIDFSLLQPNNSTILRSIWKSIANMYEILNKRKESSKHYEKFREKFFERYLNRLIENNKEEILFEGIETIKEIIVNQVLKNMPDDKEIHYLDMYIKSNEKKHKERRKYSDTEYKIGEHWREITMNTMDCFSYIITKAIKLNRPELINKSLKAINDITFKFYLEKIGIYKQCYFYIYSANIVCDYTYRAFDKNVFIEGHDAKYINPALFTHLIEEKHPAARTVLKKYCHLLINLQTINKLDRWFMGGLAIGDFITTEGELGGIAKFCVNNYHKGKEIQDCLIDCIDTFKILKSYYEENPPSEIGLYKVIKWQFENILELLENEEIENEKMIKELKWLISSFK